ncbi:alpha/beta-hydrolase [Eremomyces bilateralis CBS 781.70]|uniref:Alpha/beta-hydrolase n=1 Tax=Eremomyces bilateralis CBS 781.70 TaxID=1392243 RepID=A0A6G1GF91_9PEZI|nr:alpha/beta-hydrolase [Eremomyces bilateralis CBS 781.70]KAF1816581.1 alpha/beta-hydrolase [Eremomyces bilateralis CBS 781.70]
MFEDTRTTPQPMKVVDIRKHPEYSHVLWPLKPSQEGKIAVAKGRGGPFNIAYEVHGNGSKRLVVRHALQYFIYIWIMGLGGIMQQWQRQTKDFAHRPDSPYSSLIFDNRGVGQSDKPYMRYSTTEMAQDIVELLDHVGWTQSRELHVIGISLGGMIAQELGLLIPSRIASLSLISTAPQLVRTLGFFENILNRINLFIPRSLDVQLATIKRNCYTAAFLDAPDELAAESAVQSFPTNGDRFAALEIQKRSDLQSFRFQGFAAQAMAAGWHHKTGSQLAALGDRVGRKRIMVVHGTGDRMVPFVHGPMLARGLGLVEEGVVRFVEGQGHVIPIEWRGRFNEWVEEMVARGEECNREEGV